MKEAFVRFDQSLMPNQQSAERAEPRECPLHYPSMPISSELPSVLMARRPMSRASRNYRFDSSLVQALTKRIAVVGAVSDQAIWVSAGCTRPIGSPDRYTSKRTFDESHFRRRRRVQVCSKRSTRAIDQYHPLRALSPLGLADFGPPFFAGAKLPSMKHSSHLIRSASANSARNARQSSSRVPSSSHFFKRRQQVAGLAYCFGSSLQGAPVQRIQSIPSKQRRSSTRGRPPLGLGFDLGRCLETASHCASVRCLQAIDHLHVISGSGAILTPPQGVLKWILDSQSKSPR